jgi:hypothetical protein
MSSKDYIPGTADENHIFETQQKFMFTVLNEHLQTDMGKPRQEIMRTHDAQKIFADLKAYMFVVRCTTTSQSLLKDITGANMATARWTRARKPRISLRGRDKIREYNSMVPAVNKLPGNASPCYNPPSPEFLPSTRFRPKRNWHTSPTSAHRRSSTLCQPRPPVAERLDQTAGSSRNRSTVRHHEVRSHDLFDASSSFSIHGLPTGQPMMPTLPAVYTAASTVTRSVLLKYAQHIDDL